MLKNRLGALSPTNVLTQYQMKLAEMNNRLDENINRSITLARHTLENNANKLDGLSPAKKLSSGFSYVVDEKGRNITKASHFDVDDECKIYFSEGSIRTKVVEVKEK